MTREDHRWCTSWFCCLCAKNKTPFGHEIFPMGRHSQSWTIHFWYTKKQESAPLLLYAMKCHSHYKSKNSNIAALTTSEARTGWCAPVWHVQRIKRPVPSQQEQLLLSLTRILWRSFSKTVTLSEHNAVWEKYHLSLGLTPSERLPWDCYSHSAGCDLVRWLYGKLHKWLQGYRCKLPASLLLLDH